MLKFVFVVLLALMILCSEAGGKVKARIAKQQQEQALARAAAGSKHQRRRDDSDESDLAVYKNRHIAPMMSPKGIRAKNSKLKPAGKTAGGRQAYTRVRKPGEKRGFFSARMLDDDDNDNAVEMDVFDGAVQSAFLRGYSSGFRNAIEQQF
mmetsp:Transcript_37515/g.61663  ORF Transcript_37515/g.61663 Transcript_37515/m.61663 type:complete len:151 (-) Transcript_37515:231-683(-)